MNNKIIFKHKQTSSIVLSYRIVLLYLLDLSPDFEAYGSPSRNVLLVESFKGGNDLVTTLESGASNVR